MHLDSDTPMMILVMMIIVIMITRMVMMLVRVILVIMITRMARMAMVMMMVGGGGCVHQCPDEPVTSGPSPLAPTTEMMMTVNVIGPE